MRRPEMCERIAIMAEFIYIDETGSVGASASSQPFLTLVAVLVHEDKVQALTKSLRKVAMHHLGWLPADFEFHGNEVWGGKNWWSQKGPAELIAAYGDAIATLEDLDLSVTHASIDKEQLHVKYKGFADSNAYLLALQFLLEKIDVLNSNNKIIVADEAKEQQLRAVKMVADMQEWGGGEVRGRTLSSVIDCLHFVRSNASPGVQLADLVAYVIQRSRGQEHHPNAQAAIERLRSVVEQHTLTWRQPWPARRR